MVVKLRTDFDASGLRSLARQSRDANQARRLLSLALVYDGKRRTEAATTGGVGLQILRDWILRFNSDGPDGLKDRWHKGPTPKLTTEQRATLIQMIEDGPIPSIHGAVRWRIITTAAASLTSALSARQQTIAVACDNPEHLCNLWIN